MGALDAAAVRAALAAGAWEDAAARLVGDGPEVWWLRGVLAARRGSVVQVQVALRGWERVDPEMRAVPPTVAVRDVALPYADAALDAPGACPAWRPLVGRLVRWEDGWTDRHAAWHLVAADADATADDTPERAHRVARLAALAWTLGWREQAAPLARTAQELGRRQRLPEVLEASSLLLMRVHRDDPDLVPQIAAHADRLLRELGAPARLGARVAAVLDGA